MSADERDDIAALDRLLGLDSGSPAPGRPDPGLDRLRRRPRLDPARKQAAWQSIERRLDGESSADKTGDRDPAAPLVEFPAGGRSRGRFVGLGAAAAVLLIVAGALFVLRDSGTTDLPGAVAVVEGRVTRNGVLLRKGDVLRSGDEILTGPAGRMDFIVDGKNVFRLLSSASLVYEIETGRARLDIRQGYLAAIVRKRDRLGTLELAAGPVISRVTGTVLFVGAPDEESGYVCICHGRIEVVERGDPEGGEIRERSAAHHYAGIFARDSDGRIKELSGDMRFHDDAMLEGLAELVGESIDWERL